MGMGGNFFLVYLGILAIVCEAGLAVLTIAGVVSAVVAVGVRRVGAVSILAVGSSVSFAVAAVCAILLAGVSIVAQPGGRYYQAAPLLLGIGLLELAVAWFIMWLRRQRLSRSGQRQA